MKKNFIKKIIITGMITLMITSISYKSASAKWIKDSNDNWSWMENDVKASGWKEIDGSWYYFSTNGIMNTGWLKYDGNWYSLSSSGAMDIGWKRIAGKWYHLESDGKMSMGWVNDNGTLYYTNSSGEMETGNVEISGKTYTFSDNGVLLNGKEANQDVSLGSNNSTNAKKTDSSRTAYVSTKDDSLNIRAKATLSSDIIGSIAKGSEIKILGGEEDGFYPIIMNGKEGWVSSKWISFNKPENVYAGTSSSLDVNTININSNNTIEPTIAAINSTSSAGVNTSENIKTDNVTPPPINNQDSNKSDTSIASKVTSADDDSLAKGVIRTIQPSLGNKHYYSDDNLYYKIKLSPPFFSGGKPIKGNCTWYAWGRAWELTGIKPDKAGFTGNAYEWWDANKKSSKYKYGSEPKVGAIAVWRSDLPGSEGSGHVAIVEKISDGKVYISESTWHGGAFGYKEIYETSHIYGYIYLDKPNH